MCYQLSYTVGHNRKATTGIAAKTPLLHKQMRVDYFCTSLYTISESPKPSVFQDYASPTSAVGLLYDACSTTSSALFEPCEAHRWRNEEVSHSDRVSRTAGLWDSGLKDRRWTNEAGIFDSEGRTQVGPPTRHIGTDGLCQWGREQVSVGALVASCLLRRTHFGNSGDPRYGQRRGSRAQTQQASVCYLQLAAYLFPR